MNNQTTLPFPPVEYMALVCGLELSVPELLKEFEGTEHWHVDLLEKQQFLGENIRFLDIGCGCGRLARRLVHKPLASYAGFDRHSGMIDWCSREISSRAPKFQFLYFSIKSGYETIDQQVGEHDASTFKFPFGAGSFDRIFLASVFTHMSFREVSNYLSEIYRMLSPSGKVLFTVFFSETEDEVSYNGIDFYLPKEQFHNELRALNFDYKMVGTTGAHHWYVLEAVSEFPCV